MWRSTRARPMMGRLKGSVVADVVVPTPDYVRFATHFGFRADFCEGGGPESKGVVEPGRLCAGRSHRPPPVDGRTRRRPVLEVNAKVHSEVGAVPATHPDEERKVLRPLPSLRPPFAGAKVRRRRPRGGPLPPPPPSAATWLALPPQAARPTLCCQGE